jgi:hypothetical protein
MEAVTSLQIKPDPFAQRFPFSLWPSFDNPFFRQAIAESKRDVPSALDIFVSFLLLLPCAAANQGERRLLGFSGGRKGKKNNQAAQAIDQSKFFGGGINQGQAGKRGKWKIKAL